MGYRFDPSRDPYQSSERKLLESAGEETPHRIRRLLLHGGGHVGAGILVGRNSALLRPRLTARTALAPFLPLLPMRPALLGSHGAPFVRFSTRWSMCRTLSGDIGPPSNEFASSRLSIDADGTWSNADGRTADAEFVYECMIAPTEKIASAHQVGFIVKESGLFGVKVYWDIDLVAAYHQDFLEMLNRHGIGWCYCELYNVFPKHLVNIPYI